MLETGPSQHLSWAELACHADPPVPYPREWTDRALVLASEFEALREECSRVLGHAVKIRVTSAYRTPEHNAATSNSASHSQHLDGRALDLAAPAGLPFGDFVQIVHDQASRRGIIRGIGVYPKRGPRGAVHVDVRLQARLARWEG